MRPATVATGSADGDRPAAREGGAFRQRAGRAWLAPDVALVAAWVTLFYCLFLFQGYQKLFRDSDAGWHIRSGEAMLATGTLPRTDPYSFTGEGRAWFAWEWASDLVTGAVHRAGGLGAVAMLYGTAIAAATWLWFRLHWAARGNFLLACAMTPLLLSTGNLHWLARPHIFSWLLLLGALLLVERGPRGFGRRDLVVAAVGGAAWANLHASFFFGPLIALVWCAGHAVRALLWEVDRAGELRRARWLAGMAAAGALGSLFNPFGFTLHRHILQYLSDSDLLSRIGEFQSFDFHAEGASQILAAVLTLVAGSGAALAGRRPEHAVLMLAVAAAALRSARVLPLVALLLPLANGAFTSWLRSAGGLRPAARQAVDAFLGYSDRLRRLDAGCGGWGVAWVVPVLCFLLLRTPAIASRTGFPPDQFPVAAAAQVEKLPPGARLFAPDKFGGYLIYRFAGGRKVFFDGRSDFYGADFLKRYGRMAQVRPGWREIWDGFSFTHALLPNDYSLIPALEGIGWRRIYRDGTATLLEGPGAGQAWKSVPTELKDMLCVRTLYRPVPDRGSVPAGGPARVSFA